MMTLPDIQFSHDLEYGARLSCTGEQRFEFGSDPANTLSTAGINSVGNYNCIRLGGQAICWGHGGQGQLGQDSSIHLGDDAGEISTVEPISFEGTEHVIQITGSYEHSCALFADGKVRCWGYNNNARLGIGSTGGIIGSAAGHMTTLSAINFAEPTVRAVNIASGGNHNCVLFENGRIRCFGYSSYGQLGYGSTSLVGNSGGAAGMLTIPYIDFSDQSIPAKQVRLA